MSVIQASRARSATGQRARLRRRRPKRREEIEPTTPTRGRGQKNHVDVCVRQPWTLSLNETRQSSSKSRTAS